MLQHKAAGKNKNKKNKNKKILNVVLFYYVPNQNKVFLSYLILSWLKGIKPGENPKRDAIKSNEIFPQNYNVYRNDRGTLGEGVLMFCLFAAERSKDSLSWSKCWCSRCGM
jgi:hypothetical protein